MIAPIAEPIKFDSLRNAELWLKLKGFTKVRGILRNRLNYINEKMCMSLLNHAIEKGVQMSQLSEFAKTVKNWTTFKAEIEGL